MSDKRLCILYHYFEASPSYRVNLQHFLTFGAPVNADIYCIIAGKYSINLPTFNRIHYIHTENKNWDYGGYARALNEHINTTAYDYFVFVNSSVRGPFMSPSSSGSWFDQFLNHFAPDVGIVGCAINILSTDSIDTKFFQERYPDYQPPYAHVQSTAYILSAQAINVLLSNDFYKRVDVMNKADVICHYEILMSQLLIQNGFNLKCLLPEYNQIDYRKPYIDPNPTSHQGDPCTPDGYFGRTIHPYEGLFVKTQRGLYPNYYLDLLTHSMLLENSASTNYLNPINLQELLQAKYIFDSHQSFRALIRKLRRALKRFLRISIRQK